YNFKFKLEKNYFNDIKNCKEVFQAYLIYKNNRTTVETNEIRNIKNIIDTNIVSYYKIRKLKDIKYDFSEFIIKYSFKDSKYKNCFACRFFDENNSWFSSVKYFCKRLRKEIQHSNIGNNCDKFWRVEKTPNNN
ncbi:MAG: hypothetical protein ACK40Y_10390, partial [Cloacibacterium caeni]